MVAVLRAACVSLLSYLSLQGGHKLPRVGVRVVALHRVQLVAVVPPSDGVNVAAEHTDAVVSVLLLQRLDGAPAVVTGVVPGKHGRASEQGRTTHPSLLMLNVFYFINVI